MDNDEWLASLKPGDQAAIRMGMNGSYRIVTVARRTKLHIIIESGARYRVTTGRALTASRWSSDYIEAVTPEVLAAIARNDLEHAVWSEIAKIQSIHAVRALSNERLEELLSVLSKGAPE